MKELKYSFSILLLCLICTSLEAQEAQLTQSINDGSISEQFEFVIRKSSNWNDDKGQAYEVIKRDMVLTLKAHTLDSLLAVQAKLDNTNHTLQTQQKEITSLKTNLATTQEILASTNLEKDSMVLLGKGMSKTSYSMLMWTVIAALLTGLMIFIFKFKYNHAVTKAAENALTDLELEFKKYRRMTLEKEQKIRRQLQDQINKNERLAQD